MHLEFRKLAAAVPAELAPRRPATGSRSMRSVRGLIFVSLIFALAASAARAEVAGNARGRTERVTEGTLFWRTTETEHARPGADAQDRRQHRRDRNRRARERSSGVHEPERRVGGRPLRLSLARGRGGRPSPHEGRRPIDRGRDPGAVHGQGAVRASQARRTAREPRRAGAAQRLHDVGREHRARRRDHDRDRVPADRSIRLGPVPPALPDGGWPTLYPGRAGARTVRRHRLVVRYAPGARRLADHAPGRAPVAGPAESRQPHGRAGSR